MLSNGQRSTNDVVSFVSQVEKRQLCLQSALGVVGLHFRMNNPSQHDITLESGCMELDQKPSQLVDALEYSFAAALVKQKAIYVDSPAL
jgi:hypothetical protein